MKAKKGFELQNVCGEYIIVPAGIENVDFSRIISLNPTAAFLWEKVSSLEEFTIETLVEALPFAITYSGSESISERIMVVQ